MLDKAACTYGSRPWTPHCACAVACWACCRPSELVATDLGKSVGSNAGLVLIHYDVKLSGEAITAPHLRIPPFQEKAYEKMVSSLLEARSQTVNADCKPVLNLDARAL